MSVTSKGKVVIVTGDQTKGNGTSPFQPTGGNSVLLAGGGMGMVNAKDSEAECTKAGHPVDVITGAVVEEGIDTELPGLIPVLWYRAYSSIFNDEVTSLGVGGWTLGYEQWLETRAQHLALKDGSGREVSLPLLNIGEEFFKRSQGLTVRRTDELRYTIQNHRSRLTREFRAPIAGQRAMLERISDRLGNAVQFEYQAGQLVRMVDTAQRALLIAHNTDGFVSSLDIEAGGQKFVAARYEYGNSGELMRVVDSLGRREEFEYDGFHRMVSARTKNGILFRYRYDDRGRCVQSWGDGGLYALELHFDDAASTSTTVACPEPKEYTYNPQGAIVRVRSLDDAAILERDYDDDLLLVAIRNGGGEERRFEWDDRGLLVSESDPAGNVTRYEYAGDELVARFNPDGTERRLDRDTFGNLIGLRDGITQYSAEWDRFGRLTKLHGRDGQLFESSYDDQHNRVATTDARGGAHALEYDALGRLIAKTDALGRRTTIEYDAASRPVRSVDGDGTEALREFDALDNLTSFTSCGRTFRIDYVGLGALSRAQTPDGSFWSFGYDTDQRLHTVTNAKQERVDYELDSAGGITLERTFDGRRLLYSYDASRRLRRIDYSKDLWREFEYNALGDVVLDRSPHGDIVFERDKLGRLTRAVLTEGPEEIVTEIERDVHGRVILQKASAGVLEYSWHPDGYRLSRVRDGEHRLEYQRGPYGTLLGVRGPDFELRMERDVGGRERRRSFGQAAVVTDYDEADAVVARRVERQLSTSARSSNTSEGSPGANVLRMSWDYAASGIPLRSTNSQWGDTTFLYNVNEDLVGCQGTSNETYLVDANGQLVGRGTSQPWGMEAGGRVQRTPDHVYEYDDSGCRVRRASASGNDGTDVVSYVWDVRGRLRRIELSDGAQVTYFYDAFARRVRKDTVSADGTQSSTHYLWDDENLASEIRGDGSRVEYVFDDNFGLLVQVESGEVQFAVPGFWNTPEALVDPTGSVIWSAKYSPWGERLEIWSQAGAECSFGHIGHYHDVDTGLIYNWHRYYDAKVGCWLSPDPLGLDGGNLHYALDAAPTFVRDPFGLAEQYELGTMDSVGSAGPVNNRTVSPSGSQNFGDDMDAHELLQNAWLDRNIPGHNGNRQGSIGKDNPAIALDTASKAANNAHYQVNNAQDAWEPDLVNQGPAKNIRLNADALYQALLNEGNLPACAAKAKVRALLKRSCAFAKTLAIPPCQKAALTKLENSW